MDDKVINIFLEDGQKREYLINSKHTVERIKEVVLKDHDPTFGGTVADEDQYQGKHCLSVVTFFVSDGEYTIRSLEREQNEILLYILFPSERPAMKQPRKSRASRRVPQEEPPKLRYELLFHRYGAKIDLTERKFVEMCIPRTTSQKRHQQPVNYLTVRIANPDKIGTLRKQSAKKQKWKKKYFLLKQGVLWYVSSAWTRFTPLVVVVVFVNIVSIVR